MKFHDRHFSPALHSSVLPLRGRYSIFARLAGTTPHLPYIPYLQTISVRRKSSAIASHLSGESAPSQSRRVSNPIAGVTRRFRSIGFYPACLLRVAASMQIRGRWKWLRSARRLDRNLCIMQTARQSTFLSLTNKVNVAGRSPATHQNDLQFGTFCGILLSLAPSSHSSWYPFMPPHHRDRLTMSAMATTLGSRFACSRSR